METAGRTRLAQHRRFKFKAGSLLTFREKWLKAITDYTDLQHLLNPIYLSLAPGALAGLTIPLGLAWRGDVVETWMQLTANAVAWIGSLLSIQLALGITLHSETEIGNVIWWAAGLVCHNEEDQRSLQATLHARCVRTSLAFVTVTPGTAAFITAVLLGSALPWAFVDLRITHESSLA